ncbi:Zinc finger matrin-type protein 2 [Paragonimus heterotremus]|uniref:Zinc finger matrin-type protein 2 n=1 Tax=Paragonimus heterotremus TaxID=100268 RepID=A0A8J4WHQ3_9TREM|nr:Zinc finger matrin-type protein 2 [Paragonimus heterotremus]
MAGSNPTDHRRKWDRVYFEKLADDKLSNELEALKNARKEKEIIKKEYLRARDYTIDLESNLNKSQVIAKTGPGSSQAGYYCEVCDCVVKDSINYLDHINGKKHQRNMGMSMRIKRSTLEDVKERFQLHSRKKEEKTEEYNLDERMKQIAEEEEKLRAYRNEKRKEKKRKNDDSFVDEEVATVMGFGGFGKRIK